MPGVLQVLKSLQVGRGLSLERIGDTSCISSNFFRYGIPNRENAPIKLGMSLCSSTAPAASSMRSNQHHCYQSHALRRHHHSSPSPPDTIMTWWIGLGFGGGGRGPSPILFDFCTSLSSVQTVGRWRVFFHNLFFLFFPFLFLFFPFALFVCQMAIIFLSEENADHFASTLHVTSCERERDWTDWISITAVTGWWVN